MNDKKITVYLHGKLGILFGKKWELYVRTPAEALRAINVNTENKFAEYVEKVKNRIAYKIGIKKKSNLITEKELGGPVGSNDIHVMPTLKGASGKKGGFFMILAAVVLAVVTVGASWGPTMTAMAYSTAASLALGGIMMLLTPVPKMNEMDRDDRTSKTFAGNATTVIQGTSVGLVYGRSLVAPMPISLSYDNYPEESSSQVDIGEGLTRVDLPDGGFYYV
jgi:predicted phage tail protein